MIKNFDIDVVDIITNVPIEEAPNVRLTVRSAIIRALTEHNGDGDTPSGQEKVDRFNLAVRINSGGDQEVTIDQLALIKKVSDMRYITSVYGQIMKVLEG